MPKKKIIITILCVTLVIFLCPLALELFVYRNSFNSVLDNEDWNGFLGGYIGGVIGGIFTLLAVFFTTKQTRDIQDNIEGKQTEEKEKNEKNERRKYIDSIYDYIGKYLTNISGYFYDNSFIEHNRGFLNEAKYELTTVENELLRLYEEIEKTEKNQWVIRNQIRRAELKRDILIRKYNRMNDEMEEHSADRTIAVECYYILKLKLEDISYSKELLDEISILHNHLFDKDYKWLESESKKLMTLAKEFGEAYINKTYDKK